MRYPEYKVCWIKKETCTACGQASSLQQTYGFFSAENALKHAGNVLKEEGCTLLYIEL